MIPTRTHTLTKERAAPTKKYPAVLLDIHPVNVWTSTRPPLLLRLHPTGFIWLRSMHKRFHIMLIAAFVVVSKSSGTAALERRERENEDRKKLWLSFLSCRSHVKSTKEKTIGKTRKTQKSWKLSGYFNGILSIAVCAHYNNATWNRNSDNNTNNNWKEFF